MNTINVKGLTIGEGIPKICVPLVGKTLSELVEEASIVKAADVDLIEWRVDYFKQVEEIEKVKAALTEIRNIVPNYPLIFTFRSKKEGGEKEVSSEYYFRLNREICQTELVDLIDVELFNDEKAVISLINKAHQHNIYVIVSNHDFEQTPPKDVIVARLLKAQDLGADIPKIAVMPNNVNDVLTLLEASYTMKEKHPLTPIITMSMGGTGVITRLAGEVFGSSVTFGSVKKASAPGQVNALDLKNWLEFFHNNL